MRIFDRVARAAATFLTAVVCLSGGAAASGAQPVEVVSDGGGVHAGQLVVAPHQSQVLRVDRPYAQALIGDSQIADVLPLTNQSIYVLGKRNGTTSLTLYDRGRNLIAILDVVVGPDIASVRRQLEEFIPGERIDVRLAAGSIVLSGVVTNAVAARRAVQIAEAYLAGGNAGDPRSATQGGAAQGPGAASSSADPASVGSPSKVINMLSVGSSQQVMLEVRFSEMRRGAARQLGFNHSFISDSGNFQGSFGENAPSSALLTNENGAPTIDISGILNAFGVAAAGFNIGNLNIFSALDALERKGIVTTLAEPTLIALSGETASFLAGGEFPIPVLQGGGDSNRSGITIEYKPFGVSLAFTPTVLADGVISLVVAPEVSSIDPGGSVTINGLVVPALQVRRARTTLELRDGQSFAMAGLMRRDFNSTVRRFPILGSLPVIGALFRSTAFQREDTELVIIVTPRLVRPVRPDQVRVPTDYVRPSSEADLFLNGRTERSAPRRAVPFEPLPPAEPSTEPEPASQEQPLSTHLLEEPRS